MPQATSCSSVGGDAGGASGAGSGGAVSLSRMPSLGAGEWVWAYYDTYAGVREVLASLDPDSDHPGEVRLRAALKERLPLFELWMEGESVVNQVRDLPRSPPPP